MDEQLSIDQSIEDARRHTGDASLRVYERYDEGLQILKQSLGIEDGQTVREAWREAGAPVEGVLYDAALIEALNWYTFREAACTEPRVNGNTQAQQIEAARAWEWSDFLADFEEMWQNGILELLGEDMIEVRGLV